MQRRTPEMKKSLVSIVIPAYNAERYIEEAIRSALASTYTPFEIVIVNDGSTDTTQTIAEELAQHHPEIRLYQQPNSGASTARNLAITKAHGEYILPLDADNRISPDYLEEAVKVLHDHPEVKLVGSEACFIGEKRGRWKFRPFSLNLLCRRNLIDNCSMYRKRDWAEAGGYCDEILGREDWDFWLSLFERGGRFVRLPITGLYYRVRSNSKRAQTRHLHKEIIDLLNARHKPLFYSELGGRLHYQRTYSGLINKLISFFYPHHIDVNSADMRHRKIIYAANDSDKIREMVNGGHVPVEYLHFREKRIHIPGTKIDRSQARALFDPLNESHLGFYEQQATPSQLDSYLIVKH